jgi:putative peptide zinc metalloprotease protein
MLKIDDPFETVLPKLRGDLEVYRGPDDGDGTPTYNIHDPIANTYFKISWVEAEVLQRIQKGLNVKDLLENLNSTTSLHLEAEDVLQFVKQLQFQGLLEEYQNPAALEEKYKQSKPNWLMWLVFNYLFFKIPLFRPDNFLKETLPYVRPFLTVQAMIVYLVISIFGLSLVLVNWSQFIGTFTYFFNTQGIIIYSLAIIFTKIIHELAHGYTAKKYGLHVPTMGVAILLLWPILYTDATDAWKLHNRKQRLLISSAGIIVELALAGLCTILWALTSPGILNSLFFVLASLNWIATIFLNMNPAMRFDGYYITSDLLGIENLHARAFGYLRMRFYNLVAGADLPDPEPKLSASKKRVILGLAIYTWFYRLFLYTAIALFVYYQFTKSLGILLFLFEIGIFFVWPVIFEIQYIQKIHERIRWNIRLRVVSTLIVLFLLWFIVPWPIKASSPSITIAEPNHILYAPVEGVIEKIYIKKGQLVSVGDPIADLSSRPLEEEIEVLEKEIAILSKKLEITQLSDKNLPYFLEIQSELIQKQAALQGNREKKELNKLRAKVAGKIYEWDDWLMVGQFVKQNQKLGQVSDLDSMDLIAYVSESEISYLAEGDKVEFRPHSLQDYYEGTVVKISPVRIQKLAFDQLSSLHGGDIPVNADKEMIESYYAVQIRLEETHDLRFGMTGNIQFWGPWRSRAFLLADRVFSVILRESGW